MPSNFWTSQSLASEVCVESLEFEDSFPDKAEEQHQRTANDIIIYYNLQMGFQKIKVANPIVEMDGNY